MPSIQNTVVNTQQLALGDLYARAVTMARLLGSTRVASGVGVPEVNGFQLAWNQYRGEIGAWFESIGLNPSPDGQALVAQGLRADGKYGPKTALAFAMLLFAAGLDERTLSSMPTVSTNFPVWYGQHHSLVEGVLLNVTQNLDPLPAENAVSTTQSGEDIEQMVSDAREVPANLEQELDTISVAEEDMVFESGSSIQSSAGRRAWDVPIWAIGLGVLTVGGLIWGVVKKKKRGAAIRA